MVTKMVWPRFKILWFSRDNPLGTVKGKRKKRQTEEEVGKQYHKERIGIARSTRGAENRTRWKGIVMNLSVFPDYLPSSWDRYNGIL